jgi:hypothetical protein
LKSDWNVTPTHKLSDFSFPLTLEAKIFIFEENIDG